MTNRGHEPAQGGVSQTIKVPQLKQVAPTPQGPATSPSPARVRGRGNENPVTRPGNAGVQTGSRPSGLNVGESPARVRGRGSDQPTP